MTRAELYGVRKLERRVLQQEEYVDGLKKLIASQERSLLSGRVVGGRSRHETYVIKVMTAEERLENLRGLLEEYKTRLAEKICAETDGLLRQVLIARFVKCLSWTLVSHECRTPRTVCHRLAKKFAEGLAGIVKL